MTQGRSIRLFLVDGTPNGLLTAEIMNWTGHVLTGPRSKLSELVQRPECGRTGIYFLVGPDPENSLRPLVYIGESDDVGTRLKQHNRPRSSGGKDFWEKVCLVTSKDQNLTKAHVKYLESLLIQNAGQVGRCKLINGTAHDYINLPESDRADMAFFVEQIRTVLPVLGFDFLRETSRPSRVPEAAPAAEPEASPRFTWRCRGTASAPPARRSTASSTSSRAPWPGAAGSAPSAAIRASTTSSARTGCWWKAMAPECSTRTRASAAPAPPPRWSLAAAPMGGPPGRPRAAA
jgi:hypothetical protein